MSLTFSVYGLRLKANSAIPGLYPSSADSGADVHVWMGEMPAGLDGPSKVAPERWYVSPHLSDEGQPVLTIWSLAGGEYFKLWYCDQTEFIVDRSGTRIWARWPDDLTIEDTAVYLLGPVLGFVLRLRETTCLHASAVCVEDEVIVIVGAAGAGKSTTAACFASSGYPILSDDVVALSDRQHSFLVQPAYPCLRLWPDSVNFLYGSPEALPKLVPTSVAWDKRSLSLMAESYRFQQHPLPLAAVYLLGERSDDEEAPFVEAVPPGKGLLELIANTYANYLPDKRLRAKEFETLSRVVAGVTVRRVTPHADPDRLPKLRDTILEDFHSMRRPGRGGQNGQAAGVPLRQTVSR